MAGLRQLRRSGGRRAEREGHRDLQRLVELEAARLLDALRLGRLPTLLRQRKHILDPLHLLHRLGSVLLGALRLLRRARRRRCQTGGQSVIQCR